MRPLSVIDVTNAMVHAQVRLQTARSTRAADMLSGEWTDLCEAVCCSIEETGERRLAAARVVLVLEVAANDEDTPGEAA